MDLKEIRLTPRRLMPADVNIPDQKKYGQDEDLSTNWPGKGLIGF